MGSKASKASSILKSRHPSLFLAPACGRFFGPRQLPALSRFISTVVKGEKGTPDFRMHFKDASGKDISPWHDIPLKTGEPGVYNAIFEIPKMTKPKMEVATKEENNPIAQDVKKG